MHARGIHIKEMHDDGGNFPGRNNEGMHDVGVNDEAMQGIFYSTIRGPLLLAEQGLSNEDQDKSPFNSDFSLALTRSQGGKTESTKACKNLVPHSK